MSIRTVSRLLALLAMLSGALISPQLAWAAALGPVTMSVPEGFVAAPPMRQQKVSIWQWTKSAAGGSVKALLEVTVHDYGPKLAHASPEELASGSEQYLRQSLGSIERRRANYALSPVKHVQLAGAPASKATWTGRTGPVDLVGVMYCLIVQNRYVVTLHTQDLGSTPTPAMREAIAAIESAQLASAASSAPAPTAPKPPLPEPAAE